MSDQSTEKRKRSKHGRHASLRNQREEKQTWQCQDHFTLFLTEQHMPSSLSVYVPV